MNSLPALGLGHDTLKSRALLRRLVCSFLEQEHNSRLPVPTLPPEGRMFPIAYRRKQLQNKLLPVVPFRAG